MSNRQNLLQRIQSALSAKSGSAASNSVNETAFHSLEEVRDHLSGALETPVKVKEWVEGGFRALIPVSALVPTGLRVAESVIPGYPATLTGNDSAVAASERFVAKRVSEGYVARLVGFDAPTRRAIFEVERGTEAAPT